MSVHMHNAITRRHFVGATTALGAYLLPGPFSRVQASPTTRPAKSVIMLLLEGGMSHLDTWDLKPNAPKEIRGEFSSISTTNAELRISEHMPLLSQQAHTYNVIRSAYSSARNHSPGLHWVLTGYDNPAAGVNGETVNKYPSVGSIVSHQLGDTSQSGLPNFVAIPNRSQLGGRTRFSGAVHLGAAYDAFNAGTIPQTARESYVIPTGLTLPADVELSRLAHRRQLLQQLDDFRRQADSAEALNNLGTYQQKAFDLLLGEKGRAAFDINREPDKVRRAYGNSEMGQGTLLARRLVEAGVNYVLVNYSKNNSFDTHSNNFGKLKDTLLPPLDRAVSTLLVDLEQRGLLDDTLVVMMGEMGRTPIINKRQAGRDHWPDVYSILMAGGGLTRGQLLGSSSRNGEKPGNRPVHLQEVIATMYHQFGIDPHLILRDQQNRPVPILSYGSPVGELIAG